MFSSIGITILIYVKNPTYGIEITNDVMKVTAFSNIAII